MLSKIKYIITNEETAVAIIYENEKYGRTVVIQEKINLGFPIRIYDKEKGDWLDDIDFLNFIQEILPR